MAPAIDSVTNIAHVGRKMRLWRHRWLLLMQIVSIADELLASLALFVEECTSQQSSGLFGPTSTLIEIFCTLSDPTPAAMALLLLMSLLRRIAN